MAISAALAASAAAQDPAPVVKVRTDKPAHLAGKTPARALLNVEVAPGFHINSNHPKETYLIPTALKLDSEAGIEVIAVNWPVAHDRKFSFSDAPLSVFEGTFPVSLTLKAAGASAGAHVIHGKLRYQACNDQICRPPTTADVAIPVNVAGKKS